MTETERTDDAKPVPDDRFEVGIIVAKRTLKSRWASHAWLPISALPAIPTTAPWTILSATPEEETFYAGAFEVSLHPAETSHYRDNLVSGRPSLWVALRQAADASYEVAKVTADPYEGESMAEGIGEVVEAVPMPAEIQARVLAFFEAFHVEQVFHKRKRDRADPEALARQGRAARRREDEG
ncbi:DUF3305 domain-containing protein [Methylobacterium marchantiae]|uniref:DUF3305 domain-containing protein n=1 Tax=Methylobacterium marchantiae TaxID=600331 RepID=A0ABW3X167_9HYPH|nr:hypothetical protein AIGOOFII_0713 [Methylobacterium marchantiae]